MCETWITISGEFDGEIEIGCGGWLGERKHIRSEPVNADEITSDGAWIADAAFEHREIGLRDAEARGGELLRPAAGEAGFAELRAKSVSYHFQIITHLVIFWRTPTVKTANRAGLTRAARPQAGFSERNALGGGSQPVLLTET